ncbi:hypothetical protein C8Q74DRAFT_1287157 [Fomes fomentarius]|nr:hypothetical protein C8Q74DRAFT_1287157 [Fomes fomentarius]
MIIAHAPMKCPICFDTMGSSVEAWTTHVGDVHKGCYPDYTFCDICLIVVRGHSHIRQHASCHRCKQTFQDEKKQREHSCTRTFCPVCKIYIEVGLGLEAHYIRSLLHPPACGACDMGFSSGEDYNGHISQCPKMLALRAHEVVPTKQLAIPDVEMHAEAAAHSAGMSSTNGYGYSASWSWSGSTPEGPETLNEGEGEDSTSTTSWPSLASPSPTSTPSFFDDLTEITVSDVPSSWTRGNSRADLGVPERPDANDVDVQASRPYNEPLFPPHPSASDRKGSQHEASNKEDVPQYPKNNMRSQFTYLQCRQCLQGCNEPVATPCGHIFCQRCIATELMTRTKCPVCQQTILLKLAMDFA